MISQVKVTDAREEPGGDFEYGQEVRAPLRF